MVVLGSGILATAYLAGSCGKMVAMLCLMAIGCGCFKPCLSTLLSLLYPAGDARKTKALGTYYLWIQLGALPSSLVGGWLRQHYGWGWAYSAAAIGALLSFLVLSVAWARLVPFRTDLEALVGTRVEVKDNSGEWKAGHIVTVLFGGIIFWLANQQQGSTLTFYAADRIDRHGIAAESFATLNPLFCAVLGPLLALVWRWSDRARGIAGMIATAVSFAILLVGSRNVSYFVLSYFLGALGEQLISPLGMAKITELVPRKHAALGMAGWLLTTSIGGYMAGRLGGLRAETAAIVTVGLCLVGAGWFGIRWPRQVRKEALA
jgi:dipeptide/tripeptide permease